MKNIYVDMVGDLFHFGHVELLRRAKEFGQKLIVGVHNDETVMSYKRRPVLSMKERIAVIESCKYVDQVIPDAPLVVTSKYLEENQIDLVIHGDDLTSEDKHMMFGEVLNKLVLINYTDGISTTNILQRLNYYGHNNNKAKKFRQLLCPGKPGLIMEAHNGLSAKIVQNSGFKGIWGSGLSISAALGVRDANEASWTQVLEVINFMNDATDLPILLDGDTGYGNFNNARRLVQKLDQLGVAGVCLEDKIFPKTNSLLDAKQELADIKEFCGKIRACCDSKLSKDFVVVARIEAFIAGAGLEEALKRANEYEQAGADAILVHSKKATPIEIKEFMTEWNKKQNRAPIIIVPTTYFTTYEEFANLGCALIIWANHNMRASVFAMERVCKQIYDEVSIKNLKDISTVKHVFELQNEDELQEAEKKYLSDAKSD
jgi:phosphoenolpyruvate phosphomutase